MHINANETQAPLKKTIFRVGPTLNILALVTNEHV